MVGIEHKTVRILG